MAWPWARSRRAALRAADFVEWAETKACMAGGAGGAPGASPWPVQCSAPVAVLARNPVSRARPRGRHPTGRPAGQRPGGCCGARQPGPRPISSLR